MSEDRTFEATEVREIVDRLKERKHNTGKIHETMEGFAREVVEQGTLTPDCSVTLDVSLPLRERISGKRKQDVTAMLTLERDVPRDSDREEAWRDGQFELPEEPS
jgi:hypothetical protein